MHCPFTFLFFLSFSFTIPFTFSLNYFFVHFLLSSFPSISHPHSQSLFCSQFPFLFTIQFTMQTLIKTHDEIQISTCTMRLVFYAMPFPFSFSSSCSILCSHFIFLFLFSLIDFFLFLYSPNVLIYYVMVKKYSSYCAISEVTITLTVPAR